MTILKFFSHQRVARRFQSWKIDKRWVIPNIGKLELLYLESQLESDGESTARDPRLQPWLNRQGRSNSDQNSAYSIASDIDIKHIRVKVPRWVGNSIYPRAAWRGPCIAPRFVEKEREQTPAQLRGVANRYVQAGHGPRCVVPAFFLATVAGVLAAIGEAESFCSHLLYHFKGYAFGSIGMNKTMRDTMEWSEKCWDWNTLARRKPKEEHYKAFLALAESLRPSLQHTSWPMHPDFEWLVKQWPPVQGTNGLFQQYRLLMQRIRAVLRARGRRGEFSDLQRLLVAPVLHCVPLALSLGQAAAFARQPRVTKRCLLSVIGAFVGTAACPGVVAGRPFEVAAEDLAAPGFGHALAVARSLRSDYVFRGAFGSFASLATPRQRGKLVRVVGSAGGFAEEAIASVMFGDRGIVFPSADGAHCWFAVRVYMRCRLMRAPESGCERWGSLLHDLWDANAGWKPHRMVSRLLLREAGLDGFCDDCQSIVNELAVVLTGETQFFIPLGHLVRDGVNPPPPSTVTRRSFLSSFQTVPSPPCTPRPTIHPAPLCLPRPPRPGHS